MRKLGGWWRGAGYFSSQMTRCGCGGHFFSTSASIPGQPQRQVAIRAGIFGGVCWASPRSWKGARAIARAIIYHAGGHSAGLEQIAGIRAGIFLSTPETIRGALFDHFLTIFGVPGPARAFFGHFFSISAGISAEARGARAFFYHSRGHPQGLPASGGHFREHLFGIPVGMLAGTGKRAGISAGIFGACWRALPSGAKCRGGFRTTIFPGRREAARHGGGFFLLWLGLGPCAPPPPLWFVFLVTISLLLWWKAGARRPQAPRAGLRFKGSAGCARAR